MTRRSTNVIVPSSRGSVAHQELTIHARELDRLRHRWHAAQNHLTQELLDIETSANRTLPPLISSRLIASLTALVRTELAAHEALLNRTPCSLGELMSSNAQLAPITDLVAVDFAQLRTLLRAIAAVVTGLSLPRRQAGGAGVQVPLVAFMGRGKELVTHLTRTIITHQSAAPTLTETIAGNLARAFGESPNDDRAIPSPARLDGNARDAAVITFADTPLLPLLLTPVTIALSDEIRHNHTHIVASPGWGKSQHLQEIIVGFLERPDPPSLVVVDADDEDYARLDWRRKNTKASWHFIEHTLAIADFRIELQKAMQSRPDIRMIDGTELISAIRETVPAKATTHPLVLREKIALDIFDPKLAEVRSRTELVGTVPDYAFLFVLPDGKQRAFMMELDRSTMPVAHRGFTQSSVEKKLRVYAAAARATSPASRWGLETFRVIFVTDKPSRSARIAALARAIHPDLFWTAELTGVTAPSMLLPMWRDSAGKGRVLLPQRR